MFNDKSGQLMLISAFMLAIMVVAISLTLNNVIYSSDLAYVGFMDQSRYDMLNLKDTTASEANFAFMMDNANYGTYLDDYVRSLNNITSVKGRYIHVSPTAIPTPAPIPDVKSGNVLSIYGKDSQASFIIYTSSNLTPITIPPASPPPSNVEITLTPPNATVISNPGPSELTDGFHRVTLTATLVDGEGNPVSNRYVKFSVANRTGAQVVDASGNGNAGGWLTDNSGKVVVYFWDANNTGPGRAYVQAYIDWLTPNVYSNVATIDCSPVCMHNPVVSDVTVLPVNGGKYEVTIKFNMGTFTNDMMNNFDTIFDSKTNRVGIVSYDPVSNSITYQVKINDANGKYTMQVKFNIFADCTTDGLKYKRSATFNTTGTWNSVDTWAQPTYEYLL
jgi:hypothetical protein